MYTTVKVQYDTPDSYRYQWHWTKDGVVALGQRCDSQGWIHARPNAWIDGLECLVLKYGEIYIATRNHNAEQWVFRDDSSCTSVDAWQPLPMVTEPSL